MTRRSWLGRVILPAVAACAAATPALYARQGVVRYRADDPGAGVSSVAGDVDAADPANVVVNVRGIQTIIPKPQVVGIEYDDAFDQDFRARSAKLAPDDVRGRLDLARYALDRGKFAQARDAASDAQRIDPNNRDAADLLRTIQRQESLAGRGGGSATAPSTTAFEPVPPPPAPSPDQPPQPDKHFLTDDDVNVIRQDELKADDDVHVNFQKDVKQRYLLTGVSAASFNSGTPVDQALDILATGNPKLIRDVRVLGDPGALQQYHRLQSRILSGCANSGCHGSTDAGNFVLYSPADTTPAWYTNFYILQTYSREVQGAGSTFSSGKQVKRMMVDRAHPEDSLLIQYGLPLDLAATPHPPVPGFRPMFRSVEDPTYKGLLDWMSAGLKPIPTDYKLHFETPGSKVAPRPPATTAPAE